MRALGWKVWLKKRAGNCGELAIPSGWVKLRTFVRVHCTIVASILRCACLEENHARAMAGRSARQVAICELHGQAVLWPVTEGAQFGSIKPISEQWKLEKGIQPKHKGQAQQNVDPDEKTTPVNRKWFPSKGLILHQKGMPLQ